MAASAKIPNTIYFGAFVHCISLSELEICEKGAIGVNSNGAIEFIERDIELEKVQEMHAEWNDAKVVEAGKNGFLFPGFIGMYEFCFTELSLYKPKINR